MKRCTLRNGIVVDCNENYSVTVVSVPKNYRDKNGDNWEVGELHELNARGEGGAWGKEYDIIKWHHTVRPLTSKESRKPIVNKRGAARKRGLKSAKR